MNKVRVSAIVTVALLGSLSANAAIIFNDTFDAPANLVNDMVTDAATRQTAGTTSSTYSIAGIDALTTLIGPSANSGALTPLLMRVNTTTTVGGTVDVTTDTDFGASLAGQNWTLSYDGFLSRTIGYDGFTGFAVQSAANPFGFAMVIERATGTYTAFVNGAPAGTGTNPSVNVQNYYNLTTTFDEVAGTAQVNYSSTEAGTIDLGTYAISFADGTRQVMLRNHVVDAGLSGAGLIDFRVDNLTIETIPEPATLGLMAVMGGGALWVRRRFAI